MNTRIIFILLSLYTLGWSAQISGKIKDINTRLAIKDVNVYVKGSQIGTTTGPNGQFSLELSDLGKTLVIRHISYETLEIEAGKVKSEIFLEPRIIPLQGVEIVGESVESQLEISRDLPQSISIIDSREFEIKGFNDAGDFLKTEPSVQVDEELSGRKTLSVRGGNADDVIVLYNGIRLNSPYDNTFDLSLIDLENVDHFEVIKGSNTVVYGSEAFSGVINIVPQLASAHPVKAQYRMGTFDTQDKSLRLYRKVSRLAISYSLKNATSTRQLADAVNENENLHNSRWVQSLFMRYRIKEENDKNTLDFSFMETDSDHDNKRDKERVENYQNVGSLRFKGEVPVIRNLQLMAGWQRLNQTQKLTYATYGMTRDVKSQALEFKAQKEIEFSSVQTLWAYDLQLQQMDFMDERRQGDRLPTIQLAEFERYHQGFSGILKLQNPVDSQFLHEFNTDLSIRHDQLTDTPVSSMYHSNEIALQNPLNKKRYSATLLKFAAGINGYSSDFAFEGFLNVGNNTKFPTLVQQTSTPVQLSASGLFLELQPEKVNSIEVGLDLSRELPHHPTLDGWQVTASFFQNHYEDKFRAYYTPGIPIAFYDNVETAKITGFEVNPQVYVFKKKVRFELGLAKYLISEKAAFPFKSDAKQVANLSVDHWGFSALLHWFHENQQIGWVRTLDGQFVALDLPGHQNIDVHFGKHFNVSEAQLFINFSGRNLIKEKGVVLQGLDIRDRRFYITLGSRF